MAETSGALLPLAIEQAIPNTFVALDYGFRGAEFTQRYVGVVAENDPRSYRLVLVLAGHMGHRRDFVKRYIQAIWSAPLGYRPGD